MSALLELYRAVVAARAERVSCWQRVVAARAVRRPDWGWNPTAEESAEEAALRGELGWWRDGTTVVAELLDGGKAVVQVRVYSVPPTTSIEVLS